jgi:hypothetical protein
MGLRAVEGYGLLRWDTRCSSGSPSSDLLAMDRWTRRVIRSIVEARGTRHDFREARSTEKRLEAPESHRALKRAGPRTRLRV